MANKDVLSFKEMMVEGDYLNSLTKEQKMQYKQKSVDEKRQLIHQFNPKKFQNSNNDDNKFVSWIKEHKIWSGLIALFLLMAIISPFVDEDGSQTEETKKETSTNKNSGTKDKSDSNKLNSKNNDEQETKTDTSKNESNQESNKKNEKDYVKAVKSYKAQIQIIGEDLTKLSAEIDDNNQISSQGETLLTSINTQLDTASNTINNEKLKTPDKYKQKHEDLLYADELINEGIQGMQTGDSESFDSMQVGISVADDAIKSIIN